MARLSPFTPTMAAERLTPMRFPSLPEAVAEKLREAVLAGQLKPGERLLEQKLAASFGIGQPTLREALKELEYQGFVNKIPLKGTYIATFDKNDCRELRRCDTEFHRNIAALANNRRLARTLELIVSQMLVYGTIGRKPDSREAM